MHRFATLVVATVLGFTGGLTQAGTSKQDASTDNASKFATYRSPSLTPVADWAPLFADWEATCTPNVEMERLAESATRESREIPVRYRSQVGNFTRASEKTEGWARLALTGTYQGMPIKALLWREMAEASVKEYRLLLDVPLDAALRVPHVAGKKMRAVHVQPANGGQQISLLCLKGG